jgi:UDP-glucose 4-epimerase
MAEDRILILGGGFIGHSLAKRLVENGKSVTIASRSAPVKLPDGINWQQNNFDDLAVVSNLSKYSVIVHAASTSTPGQHIYTPCRETEENLLPLLRLLEIMQDHVDIPLIFLSSGGAIYGNPSTLPIHETHKLAPVSYHAASKAAAEHFLGVFAHQGHPVTILRPSNVYGPNQPLKSGFGIIRTLLEHLKHGTCMTIWGDGTIVRDYLYIDDLVSACVTVLKEPSTGTFNVGSGHGVSLNALCHLAEKITGKTLNLQYKPARSVDVKEVVLNNTAIRNNYQWQPEFTIEQGIQMTWEWLCNSS